LQITIQNHSVYTKTKNIQMKNKMIKITSTAFLAITLLASCGGKQNKDSKAALAELKKQ
jgi:hypothetical protein